MGPIPISYAPWIPWNLCPKQLKQHPLIGATLKTLQAINQRHLLTSSLGPLTPLTTNPDFPSGMDGSIQSLYNRNTPLLVAHCLKNNKIKSQADLRKEIGQTPLHFKEYQQIHDFIMNTQRQKHFFRPLTPFKTICFLASTTTKNISLTYTWLQSSDLQESNRHKTFWESTLNKPITKDQWLQACVFPHKCAISVRLQETSFKILTNWYITPNKFTQMVSDNTWTLLALQSGRRHSIPHLVGM